MTGRTTLILAGLALALLPGSAGAQRTTPPITAADLRTRLFLISDDSMAGRATGSRGNYQTAEYIASEFRRLGLRPGGDQGGWFQTIPFFRLQAAPGSSMQVGGATLRLGPDYVVALQRAAPRLVDGKRAVFGGIVGDSTTWIPADSARDRLVVLALGSGSPDLPAVGRILRQTGRFDGAVALVLPIRQLLPGELVAAQLAGRVMTDTSRTAQAPGRILATTAAAERLLGHSLSGLRPGTLGAPVRGVASLEFVPVEFPARNVIAVLPGSDPALASTYVSMSAHNDHVGFDHSPVDHDSLHVFNRVIRPLGADSPPREPTAEEWATIRRAIDSLRRIRPPRLDSIRNGADDDGSGTAVLLEVAEYLASARPKRSVIFVSHAAEEEGLLGSRWFTDHPTVPRDSIVSEFDMDQVARGNAWDLAEGSPTYLEIIGMRRVSREYGDLVEAVNRRQPLPFTFNLTYDQPGHPLQYYCRADHYSYARYDIPALVISRGEHMDYHQVTDEAQYADFGVMERVGRFAAEVVQAVADLDHRPRVDAPRRDPSAPCVQ